MPASKFDHQLLNAIESIHAAAVGEKSWGLALEDICDFIGARAADLNVFDATKLEYLAFHPARVDPFVLKYIAEYMENASAVNPRIDRIYLPMQEGKIVSDSETWTPNRLNKTPFFADFLQTWETIDSLNTWIRRTNDGTPWIALAVHFSKHRCPPQQEERQRLALLLPHIKRAYGIEERLNSALQAKNGLQEALDHVSEAVILLDEACKVQHANHKAMKLLRQKKGISLSQDHGLLLDSTRNQNLLLSVLRACHQPESILSSHDVSPSKQIVIPQPEQKPIVLTVQHLGRSRQTHPQAVAAVLIQVPQKFSVDDMQLFRETHGLTPAELELVCGLINGKSLKEQATYQGISYETVRTHLRRVFTKTGTNRQTELIRIAGG